MTTLIVILVALAAALWVSSPFWLKRDGVLSAPDSNLKSFRQSDVLRSQLSDLEFDRTTGKVDDEEYSEMHAAVEERLESASQTEAAFDEVSTLEYSHEYSHQLAEVEAEAEILIARARRQRAATWECASCGRRMTMEDRFCASCGAARGSQV